MNGGDYDYNNDGWQFKTGEAVGIVHGALLAVVGSLSAGARSAFYSGRGALGVARAGKGVYLLLEDTVGGKILNVIDKVKPFPDSFWRVPSAIFAANAKGGAQVFLRNPAAGSV